MPSVFSGLMFLSGAVPCIVPVLLTVFIYGVGWPCWAVDVLYFSWAFFSPCVGHAVGPTSSYVTSLRCT